MPTKRTITITAHPSTHGDIKLQLTPLFNDIFGFHFEWCFIAVIDEHAPASYHLDEFAAAEADLFGAFLPSYCPQLAVQEITT